jgi:hypothetical protein
LKKKVRKRKHCWRSHGLPLLVGMELLISLFKDEFTSCKVGKIWAVPRERLGWLAGLINTDLSHNKGNCVHVLMIIFGL